MLKLWIRFVAVFFAAMSLVVVGVATSTTAQAEPVDPSDTLAIYEGGYAQPDLVANDGFVEADEAQVCRVGVQPSVDVAIIDVYNGQLAVYLVYGVEPGAVFDFTYYSCNSTMTKIVEATVTVTVLDIIRPVVKKTGEPRQLSFTNPNQSDSVFCMYGSFDEYEPDGQLTVAAGATKNRLVNRKRIDWVCYLGVDYLFAGQGHVRRIPQGVGNMVAARSSSPVSEQLIAKWREHVTK